MNVEELLQQDLHRQAAAVDPIDHLLEATTSLGRRRQRRHRMAIGVSAVAAAAIVVAGSLVIAGTGPGNSARVRIAPAAGGPTRSDAPAPIWWQSWPEGRHYGPVDQAFLSSARPTFDPAQGPEKIKVYATGSEPDGTDWAMFTDPTEGHTLQWIQGWHGQPDYGDGEDVADHATWFSWCSPTRDSHDSTDPSEFMIIIGKPGTTSISYAADGTNFTSLDIQNGIAVVRLPKFPPATAMIKLADANGEYATGAPAGAGAGTEATSGTAVPAGTPTATASIAPTPGS